MNRRFPSLVRRVVKSFSWCCCLALSVAPAIGAIFDSPYELDPPPHSGYVSPPSGTTFGVAPAVWTLTAGGDTWAVDTTTLPSRELQLSVIDLVGGPAGPTDLLFQTTAVAAGNFGFGYLTAYGFNAPEIAFVQNGVDVLFNPPSGAFNFALLPGDTFGFRLHSISGAIAGQATLTIVPEAATGAWGVLAGLAGLCWRKRVRQPLS